MSLLASLTIMVVAFAVSAVRLSAELEVFVLSTISEGESAVCAPVIPPWKPPIGPPIWGISPFWKSGI